MKEFEDASAYRTESCDHPQWCNSLKISCSFCLSPGTASPEKSQVQILMVTWDMSCQHVNCTACAVISATCMEWGNHDQLCIKGKGNPESTTFYPSKIFPAITQCFYQFLPLRLLLHLPQSSPLFQRPPTMWYMRNAVDLPVGHQSKVLSPMDASRSLSASVSRKVTCIGVTTY